MIPKLVLPMPLLFSLALLGTLLPACDGGPDTTGTSSARSAAQQHLACLDWCEVEKTLDCSINYRGQANCAALCADGGSASCTDASAVLACWQANPGVFGCGSPSRSLVAAAPCLTAVESYREANEQCAVPVDFPAEGGGASGRGGASGAAGSGG